MFQVFQPRTALVFLTASLLYACSAGPGTSPAGSSASAAKFIANPVALTPQSLASGKSAYNRLCAECHGVTGNGVSEIATELEKAGAIKPLDLTDEDWKHGSTDGEMFAIIRDGLPDGSMKGLNGRPGVGPQEMWNIVNYIRSLGPRH